MPAEALQRWLLALNTQGELAAVREAVEPDCELLRFGWGADAERVQERFVGTEAVASWLRRSPQGTVFQLEGEPSAAGERWEQRYRVQIGEFQNQGRWLLSLGPEGRIARLEHRPQDLPPQA